MKTLIAVPSMDSVPARFAQSLAMLEKVGQCAISFQIGSLIYTSRNELAKRAVMMGADYIMWLDSDMVFEPNLLQYMMQEMKDHDYDMLTGLYFRRVQPFSPVIFDKMEITDDGCKWTEFTKIPDEVFEVGACGFGCVLMRTDVCIGVQNKFGNMFAPIGNVGEDCSFCWRAREVGYKIMCDPSISLGHVGYAVINRDFYDAFNASMANELKKEGMM